MLLLFFGPIFIASAYVCLPCCVLVVIWADDVQKIHVQMLTDLSICIYLFCCGLVAFWGDGVTQVQIWVCLPHPVWWVAKCGPIGGLSLGSGCECGLALDDYYPSGQLIIGITSKPFNQRLPCWEVPVLVIPCWGTGSMIVIERILELCEPFQLSLPL